MKVINPNLNEFTLFFIPRDYNFGLLTYTLENKTNGLTFTNSPSILPTPNTLGYVALLMSYASLEVSKGDTITITLTDAIGIVYRGKAYATSQTDIQNYELIEVNANSLEL